MENKRICVHIIPKEKFTRKYIGFINKLFNTELHLFFIRETNIDAISIPNDDNVFLLNQKNSDYFIRIINDADIILIHQMSLNLMKDFFVFRRNLLKKTCWIIWGSDLYEYKRLAHSFFGCLKILFKRFFVKKIGYVGTFAHNDFDLVKKWYKFNGKCFDILYPSTIDKKQVEKIYNKKEKHEGLNIILGNSATESNQHIQIMERLCKYKEFNFKLYVPLSYGDKKYKNKVISSGRKLLDDKFIPILEFMSPDEYGDILSKMDVAIFNNNRQQATGNIELLAFLGAKIYLRNDTVMWKHYVKLNNRLFYNVDDIGSVSFQEFTVYPDNACQENHYYFSRIWDEKYIKAIWENVFAVIIDETNNN